MDDARALQPITGYSDDLALAGTVADHYANQQVFADYQEPRPANTLRRQRADLRIFARYLSEAQAPREAEALYSDPGAWRGMKAGMVSGFVRWQVKEGYAVATVNARLATVKLYSSMAFQAEVIDAKDAARIALLRGYSYSDGQHLDDKRTATRRGKKKATPTIFNEGQAELLKNQPDATPLGRRDKLLLYLFIDLGLRCGEIASLRVEQIDLSTGRLTFYREKVSLTQTHKLTSGAQIALLHYLPALANNGPLFPGRKGQKMTTRAINDRIHTLGERIGLAQLSPHDLRHYWATHASRGGTDIKTLQDAGGWKSPAMPLRYIESAKVANEGVKFG